MAIVTRIVVAKTAETYQNMIRSGDRHWFIWETNIPKSKKR